MTAWPRSDASETGGPSSAGRVTEGTGGISPRASAALIASVR
jgi:hypothetical protein